MIKIVKRTVSIFTLLAFITMAVICCCVVKGALSSIQKFSCSHCATKAHGKASPHECCFNKASPMEIAKSGFLLILLPLVAFIVFTRFYSNPYNRVVLRSLYINGPPRFVSLVPLYIRSRNIRI